MGLLPFDFPKIVDTWATCQHSSAHYGQITTRSLSQRVKSESGNSSEHQIQERERGQAPHVHEKGCASWQRRCAAQGGTTLKLGVNRGVNAMDMWVCLDETGLVFSWRGLCMAPLPSESL